MVLAGQVILHQPPVAHVGGILSWTTQIGATLCSTLILECAFHRRKRAQVCINGFLCVGPLAARTQCRMRTTQSRSRSSNAARIDSKYRLCAGQTSNTARLALVESATNEVSVMPERAGDKDTLCWRDYSRILYIDGCNPPPPPNRDAPARSLHASRTYLEHPLNQPQTTAKNHPRKRGLKGKKIAYGTWLRPPEGGIRGTRRKQHFRCKLQPRLRAGCWL